MKIEPGLTNKEKAQLIIDNGFSSLSLSTLERKTAKELDLIIELERDLEKEDYDKENIETSKSLVEMGLNILESIKKERENKGINETLKKFIIKNAENIHLNYKVSKVLSLVLFIIIGLFLLVDSIFGFSKVRDFFIKTFKKKQDENKPNKPYSS